MYHKETLTANLHPVIVALLTEVSLLCTVKSVLKGHSEKDRNLVFKTNYHLMQVKSIAECSKGSIMQYF